MESERITIRIPKPLMKAAKAKADAAAISIGEYTRSLIERDTGVTVPEHVPYFGTVGKRKLKQIARTGGKPRKRSE